jgi:hypothetical protein
MTYFVGAACVVLLVQLVFLGKLVRALGRLRSLEERMAHFGDAMSLLTETADAGFRSVAGEVERLATADRRLRVAKADRIAEAVRQGQAAVASVAVVEQVSEGEVRLRARLHPAAADRMHDTPVPNPRRKPRAPQVPSGARQATPARAVPTADRTFESHLL